MKNMTIDLSIEDESAAGYNIHRKCGEKTILVAASSVFEVDEEPYKAGEAAEVEFAGGEGQSLSYVTVDAEISAHYCVKCDEIVTLSVNI